MEELPEALGKQLLEAAGIRIPTSQHVYSVDETIDISAPAVVKAQVPVSGRGNKGGIRFVDSTPQIQNEVAALLDTSVGGHPIRSVLVEERIEAHEEYYLAVSGDGSDRFPTFIVTFRGGQNIESIPEEETSTQSINPLMGIQPFHVRTAINELSGEIESVDTVPTTELQAVASSLWTLFQERDLRLLEVNPLGVTEDGVVAMDAKAIVDNHATFRQDHDILHSSLSDLEQEASNEGVDLRVGDGRIGIVSNGAGLGLATLDMIERMTDGGFAGFIDTHGAQFQSEDIANFIDFLERAGSDVILFNIVAPFLDCEVVSEGLINAVKADETSPFVVRFMGLNDDLAIKQCEQVGFETTTEMRDAVERTGRTLAEVSH